MYTSQFSILGVFQMLSNLLLHFSINAFYLSPSHFFLFFETLVAGSWFSYPLNVHVESYPNPQIFLINSFLYLLHPRTCHHPNCSDSKNHQFTFLTPITTSDLSILLIHGHYSTLWALQLLTLPFSLLSS